MHNILSNNTSQNAAWLDVRHPNYERWKRGRDLLHKRAFAVKEIVSSSVKCGDLDILDLGSGEGGTSALFAEHNNVISFDLSLLRLKRQQKYFSNYSKITGRAENLPFRYSSFDLVILQDVIEHIEEPDLFIAELTRVLRSDGSIYLSTPNRNSFFNIVSDPHWGIPLLALFSRPGIKKYFLRFFRKSELSRNDIARLFSLRQLKYLFREYELNLKTKEAVDVLDRNPEGILWSSFHLLLIEIIRKTGTFALLKKAASNKEGFINNYFTPTFYAVLKKIPGN